MDMPLINKLLWAILGISTGAGAHADQLVAVAAPLTGEYASFGKQFQLGAEMAIADINAKGGVLGQKLRLEFGDDACDPKRAVSVAQQLVAKKPAYIFGHFCSGVTIPASLIYNEAQILQVTVSTNPLVTERGLKNLFRMFGRDDQQGLIAATFITRRFKDKKLAVVVTEARTAKASPTKSSRAWKPRT